MFVPSYPGQLSLRGPELNEAYYMRKDSLKSKRVEKVTARNEVRVKEERTVLPQTHRWISR